VLSAHSGPWRGDPVTPRALHTQQPVQVSAWTRAVCAGDGLPDLPVAPASASLPSRTPLLHHTSLSTPSLDGLVAPVPNICWLGTLCAEARRLAELLWPRAGTHALPAQDGIAQPAAGSKPLRTPRPASAQCHRLPLPLRPPLGMPHVRSGRPHTEFALSCTSMDAVRPVRTPLRAAAAPPSSKRLPHAGVNVLFQRTFNGLTTWFSI